MRLPVAVLITIAVANIASAADLLERDVRVYAPTVVKRDRVVVHERRCSTCASRELPWGGLRKVDKAELPWGDLRKVDKADLPWGGLEDCP